MATINKLVTLVSHDFVGARIWLTEYGYQSNPPDMFLGVPLALQARYVGEGAYAAYHAPRVDLLDPVSSTATSPSSRDSRADS